MLEIEVIGTPAPQGSKSFKGMFRSKKTGAMIPIMVESSHQRVTTWREAVKHASLAVMGRDSHTVPAVAGPVHFHIVFTLARPKSAKKNARPDKKPDLSKLIRCSEDALTDAGAWEDDARVVTMVAKKLYVGDEDALQVPGAVIRIKGAGE